MNYDLLGQKIKKERLRLGLSQEQLAEAADISTGFLGHIENGSRKLSVDTLVRLSSRLNVSIDYLVSDSINPEKEIYYGNLDSIIKGLTNKEVDKIAEIVKNVIEIKTI